MGDKVIPKGRQPFHDPFLAKDWLEQIRRERRLRELRRRKKKKKDPRAIMHTGLSGALGRRG